MIKGLASPDHAVRGTAAMALVDFGSPAADNAKPVLLKALTEADESDKPQIAWALVALKESSAFDADPRRVQARPPGQRAAARRLPRVRREQARRARLDRQDRVARGRRERERAPARRDDAVDRRRSEVDRHAHQAGAGPEPSRSRARPRSASARSRATRRCSLSSTRSSRANKESREKFLQALRDGVGANGLVLALKTIKTDNPDTEKFQTKQIFDMLKELEDPRGGDALYAYIQSNAKPHWKFEAAMRMAEIGDVRAAEYLGWRMAQDPLKLYNEVDWPELRRDDNERVYGGAHARRPRGAPPREARLPPEGRRAGRPVVGRPGEQAAAARQRHALSRARRLPEGHADAHEVGGPEGQAPGRGRAAAVPRDLGDGAERAPLPRLGEGAERLGHPREAAAPPQREARRVVGLAHAGRPHHPRHDAARARRGRRPTASRSGAIRRPTTTS